MALTSECEVHGWSWDPADDMGCPVCHGMEEEQERIVKLIEEAKLRFAGQASKYINPGLDLSIALIKGENE